MKRKCLYIVVLMLISQGCGFREKDNGAIDFRLDTFDHQRFYLHQQKGKVVVLIFWATWCRICKHQLSDFQSFQDRLNNDNFIITGICIDPENMDDIRRTVTGLNIRFPILLDRKGNVLKKYNITSLPGTVILDTHGKKRFSRTGYSDAIGKQIRSSILNMIENHNFS